METRLRKLAFELNINLSDKQIEQFLNYMNLLIETNKNINLTAITDEGDIILKHFIDSLTINKYIENNKTLLDVGTGAGFPGIPIKIIRDDSKIVLLDSLNKRINFLNTVIDKLNLNNISTIHGRAEDIAHDKNHREEYDYVTARAVANLATLSELCIPFLKIGGSFICMKANAQDELLESKNAISKMGGEIILIDKFYLPDSNIERNIIIIKKIKSTPNIYPRKAGKPAKEPIK